MKRFLMALSIAALGLAFSGTAEAFTQTVPLSMNISATKVAACTASTSPLAFGSYDGTATSYTTSTITVNCSNGTPYRIDIDAGQNAFGGLSYPRYVKTGTATADATNTIQYNLYKINIYSVANFWGDNGATFWPANSTPITGKDGTGTGLDEVHTVYGLLYGNALAPIGAYSDTVTVTVNY